MALSIPTAAAQQAPPAANGAAPLAFRVARASSGIEIDGRLDEQAWKGATVVPLAWEYQPGDAVQPPVKTECLVTFDQVNLYVAFRALDPNPGSIRAHLMDRDDTETLVEDDHVGLMIDTFNDERRAFQFRINPLGVQADAVFAEQDGVEDFSWDMIWASSGRITDQGYVVELALPLKQLRFQHGAGAQTWGFEAFRSWPRNVRHRMSSVRRDRNKACLLCQENKITGFENVAQGRNIEFDPTATFRRTDARPITGGPLERGDIDADPGLTARWSITPSTTFSGALHPDFSQVEADVAQLDVNTRFALFYPEKRPFFLEGLDFFTTPVQAVFTRTVSDPYFGAKLTGKSGANAFGLFVTRDRVNNLVIPANQGSQYASLDDGVTTTVGRYRRDVGRGSTIGGMVASREGQGYHNRQIGADAFWRIGPSDAVRVQLLGSQSAYPAAVAAVYSQPAGSFRGNALWADYQHVSRNWNAAASVESYSPGFRSDTGYVPRVDLRQATARLGRVFQRGAGSWFNLIEVGAQASRATDAGWTLTDQTVGPYVAYAGPYQTTLQVNAVRDVVVFEGVRYDYPRPNFTAGIKPYGGLNLQVTGRFGGGVDFANGRKATRATQVGPQVDFRPVRRVSLRVSYNLDELSVEGGRLYRANLSQLRVLYFFNVRTFVRAVLQYTDITRDPSLYSAAVDARSKKLFSQYLFSYKLNPQTVLFIGYSDNAINGPALDLQRNDRTFFVKVGYAWVL